MAPASEEVRLRYFEAFRFCVLNVLDGAMLERANEIVKGMLDQAKRREGQP
jgi:hypothetical protein